MSEVERREFVLSVLSESNNPLTIMDMCEIMDIPRRSLHNILTDLIDKGKIERRVSLKDARQNLYAPIGSMRVKVGWLDRSSNAQGRDAPATPPPTKD